MEMGIEWGTKAESALGAFKQMVLYIVKNQIEPAAVTRALRDGAGLSKQWVSQIKAVACAPEEVRSLYLGGFISIKKALGEIRRNKKTDAQKARLKVDRLAKAASVFDKDVWAVENGQLIVVLNGFTKKLLAEGVTLETEGLSVAVKSVKKGKESK